MAGPATYITARAAGKNNGCLAWWLERMPSQLLKAGIPCVVWAEDALSIVHRVPTALLDQQLLVPYNAVDAAVRAICYYLPCYSLSTTDNGQWWKDARFFNKDQPHAFDLNVSTFLLVHSDPAHAHEMVGY